MHEPGDRSTEVDDVELVRRIMAASPGIDAPAEAEFCRRMAPRLRLYGLKHLRTASGAADLEQDVLILTLERLRTGDIREPRHIVSFMFGVCRQTVSDQRRGRDRRDRILSQFAADWVACADAGETLDLERLQLCLQRLSERERAVILLSFFEDKQAVEVGQELGVTPQNVRVIRHRSIERLRRCVDDRGEASE